MTMKRSAKRIDKTGANRKHRQSKRKQVEDQNRFDHRISKSKQSKKQERLKRKRERLAGRKARRRIFPIWLRLIVISLLCVVALVGGLMVGYGILGDGAAKDALKWETWQHIIDIVKKKNK